jgi:hypothetical protein
MRIDKYVITRKKAMVHKKTMVPVLILAALVVCVPQAARAEFFDDSGGKWWMNQDQWQMMHPEAVDQWGEPYPVVVDQNDRLEYTFPNPNGAIGSYNGYKSTWQLNLTQDFELSVGFHLADSVSPLENRIQLVLGWQPAATLLPQFGARAEVANHYTWGSESQACAITDGIYFGTGGMWSSTDGVIAAQYYASQDRLHMVATGTNNEVFSGDMYGLRTVTGFDSLNVGLEGGGIVGAFTGDQAYFKNFNLIQGTPITTPEPVSSALFLLGGGALMAYRIHRRVS